MIHRPRYTYLPKRALTKRVNDLIPERNVIIWPPQIITSLIIIPIIICEIIILIFIFTLDHNRIDLVTADSDPEDL